MRPGAHEGHERAQPHDAPDAMREWRWRSYTDHLEDLGYDLDGGHEPVPDPVPAGLSGAATTGSSRPR